MKSGMIYLYDWEEKLVDGRRYDSVIERRAIIVKWEKLYSVAFKHCSLRISPVVSNLEYPLKRVFEYKGERMPLGSWAQRYGLKYTTLKNRVNKWGFERALTQLPDINCRKLEFKKKLLTVAQWAKKLNIKPHTIYARLRRGWDSEETLTTPIGYHKWRIFKTLKRQRSNT